MKKNAAGLIKLGVFMTIGILLFTTGIYYIGQKKRLFTTIFRLSAVFKNVSGLQVGNNVRFAGINVGTVEGIDIIADTSIKVNMIIDKETQQFIKTDAKAFIGSDGLMGNKIINISPGTSNQNKIKDNDVIGTVQPVEIDQIWGQLKKTSDNTVLITNDLADIIKNIHSGKGTIGKLFMDTSLAKNLDQTMINVKKGAKGFEENMNAARHSILLRGLLKKKQQKPAR